MIEKKIKKGIDWFLNIVYQKKLFNEKEMNVDLLLNVAYKLKHEGKIESAIKLYERIIKCGEPNYKVYADLGGTLIDLKKYKEAQSYLLKALELEPRDKIAIYNLGYLHFQCGEYQDALQNFSKAIEIDPHYVKPWLMSEHSLQKMGKNYEAFNLAMKFIGYMASKWAERKEIPSEIIDVYHIMLMSLYAENFQEVIKIGENIINRGFESPNVYFALGLAASELAKQDVSYDPWEQKNIDTAIKWFKKCLNLDINFTLAHLIIADYLFPRARYDEAIEHYRLAAQQMFSRVENETDLVIFAESSKKIFAFREPMGNYVLLKEHESDFSAENEIKISTTIYEYIKNIQKEDWYLFNWDKIPGNDSGVLIKYLKKKLDIDWVETAKIEKINDGNAIRIYSEQKSLMLRLDKEKNKVNLMIDDIRVHKFIMKTENGERKIYAENFGKILEMPRVQGSRPGHSLKIIAPLCIFERNQKKYIVYKRIGGETLTTWLTKNSQKRSREDVMTILTTSVCAVASLHKAFDNAGQHFIQKITVKKKDFLEEFKRRFVDRVNISFNINVYSPIATYLSTQKQYYCHGDLHGNNLIIDNLYYPGIEIIFFPTFLDFESLCLAPSFYDIAVLIESLNVSLNDSELKKLLGYYLNSLADNTCLISSQFYSEEETIIISERDQFLYDTISLHVCFCLTGIFLNLSEKKDNSYIEKANTVYRKARSYTAKLCQSSLKNEVVDAANVLYRLLPDHLNLIKR